MVSATKYKSSYSHVLVVLSMLSLEKAIAAGMWVVIASMLPTPQFRSCGGVSMVLLKDILNK